MDGTIHGIIPGGVLLTIIAGIHHGATLMRGTTHGGTTPGMVTAGATLTGTAAGHGMTPGTTTAGIIATGAPITDHTITVGIMDGTAITTIATTATTAVLLGAEAVSTTIMTPLAGSAPVVVQQAAITITETSTSVMQVRLQGA